MKTQILDHTQVQKIIKRMAYQIYEHNFSIKSLVIASINGQGDEVARLLGEELRSISGIRISYARVSLDKTNPGGSEVLVEKEERSVKSSTVLLVDDVLNTGRTLIYGMSPFLASDVASLQVAVLVDRNHKNFPVFADYKGISLQTTLQQHVTVSMKNKKINVYLE